MPQAILSPEQCKALAEAMEQKYTIYLDDRSFHIEVEVMDPGLMVTTTLKSADEAYYYPVEARMLYKEEELEPAKAAVFLIDYIDSYFEDFLTSAESTYLRIDWSDMEYEGVKFQMKGQILNRKAEKMADDLLKSGEKYNGPNIIY